MKNVGTSMITSRVLVSFRRFPPVDINEKPKSLNVNKKTADITNCLPKFLKTITFKVLYVSAF